MTQEELKEKISDVVLNPYYADDTKITKAINLINQHVKEVIGDDEKLLNRSGGGAAIMNGFKSVINEQKSEQRKRAGL